jgi:hypothetical protein
MGSFVDEGSEQIIAGVVCGIPIMVASSWLVNNVYGHLGTTRTMLRVKTTIVCLTLAAEVMSQVVRALYFAFVAADVDGGVGGDGDLGWVARTGEGTAAAGITAVANVLESHTKHATSAAAAAAAAVKATLYINGTSSSTTGMLGAAAVGGAGGSPFSFDALLASGVRSLERILGIAEDAEDATSPTFINSPTFPASSLRAWTWAWTSPMAPQREPTSGPGRRSAASLAAAGGAGLVRGALSLLSYMARGVLRGVEWLAVGIMVALWSLGALPYWVLHVYPAHEADRVFRATQMHRAIVASFGFPNVFAVLFWVVAAARWPCPRAAFLLQSALTLQFWVIAGILARRQFVFMRRRRAGVRASLRAGAAHAWSRLIEPTHLQVDVVLGDGVTMFRLPPAYAEPVAKKAFVVHALVGTVMFLAACADSRAAPWRVFAPPLPPRWPWTPVWVLARAAVEDVPAAWRTLAAALSAEEATRAIKVWVLRAACYGAAGCAGVSGWAVAWRQRVQFARALDPATHATCCGVCMEGIKAVVMVPCGHQLCRTCAPKVDKCPQCRVIISDRVLVHP